ncbi:hypothetical protein KC19_2G248200 [Ceratodon purpureus]|uniref:Ternary complex factor MIP1 leucine-zipper domain-containing protein n=1 Tax=Ceratodon purpureus TaxID=3225 RepID=A0A8T0IZ43_CERPU|nr:hypothetical protein KC19_2G248200 [Ceratodon purpureus]
MQDIPYDVSHVPIDYDEYSYVKEVSNKISRKDERRERNNELAALERDVSKLQKQLIIEINMRNALNRGLSRPLGSLPRIYASLPVETRELLLEVAVLEEEIVSLEKQVVHLGREIDIEVMPTTDKEPVLQNSNQDTAPENVKILDYPSVSAKDSARVNSKPSLSPRKSIDQKCNLSNPSLLSRKVTENKSSFIKTVSNPSRNSVDIGSHMKSSRSPKDSPELRITSTLVPPQKPQLQRSSSLPKVSRNTKDLKTRRLSLAKKEPQEITFSPTHTVPFIPMKISTAKEDEEHGISFESTGSPLSPAPLSPSDFGSSCSQPSRIKTENGKPPMTRNALLGRKDLHSNKVAPTARILKAQSTPRPPGQEKGLQHTSRLPRQSPTADTTSTQRTMKSSTAAFERRMNTQRSSSTPNPSATSNCDSNLQVPVDAELGKVETNNEDTPVMGELDGECKSTRLSPDFTKINQPNYSPVRYSNLGMENEADSVFLSEEVIKLLKTIYGNMQERQTPLESDFDSSSQASVSPSHFSASPDDYEIRGAADINFKLSDCYTGSYNSKRSVSMKYMRDCGEVADALDPYTYLNRGNMSNRADFHQRLMS